MSGAIISCLMPISLIRLLRRLLGMEDIHSIRSFGKNSPLSTKTLFPFVRFRWGKRNMDCKSVQESIKSVVMLSGMLCGNTMYGMLIDILPTTMAQFEESCSRDMLHATNAKD